MPKRKLELLNPLELTSTDIKQPVAKTTGQRGLGEVGNALGEDQVEFGAISVISQSRDLRDAGPRLVVIDRKVLKGEGNRRGIPVCSYKVVMHLLD